MVCYFNEMIYFLVETGNSIKLHLRRTFHLQLQYWTLCFSFLPPLVFQKKSNTPLLCTWLTVGTLFDGFAAGQDTNKEYFRKTQTNVPKKS